MNVLLDNDVLIDIQLPSDELTDVLANLKGIVEKKTTLPILYNVLIETINDSEILVTAADMDMSASKVVSSDVKKKGKLTIPAITFYEVVKTLKPGSIVNIVLKKNSEGQSVIEVSSGKYFIRLPYISADSFPVMTIDDYTSIFEITAKDLKNLIDKTRFAISTDESRFYLNGLYIHVNDANELCAVSTDLHRLAKSTIEAPKGSENLTTGIILPLKAVQELNKLLDNSNAMVEIKASSTKVSFEFDKTNLITKLIDGVFPEYEAAIPENPPISVNIEKSSFEHSVTLVSISAPEKTKSIRLSFDKNSLVLSTNSDNLGNSMEEMEIEYKFDPLEICFNARYILDVLKTIVGDNIVISLIDSFSAMVIKDADNDKDTFIVMPTRG